MSWCKGSSGVNSSTEDDTGGWLSLVVSVSSLQYFDIVWVTIRASSQ